MFENDLIFGMTAIVRKYVSSCGDCGINC